MPYDLQQVGVPHPDTGAGIGDVLTLMGAGEIPVLLPLSLINCPAGTQGIAAFGADGDAGEDALAHMVIGPVIPRTPSKVSLCPLIEIVGHQRRMGVLRHGPIPPGNRDFFLGLDADLLALAQKSMTQIDRVFQNALDRRIVPQIRCPGRSFLTEFVSVQHSRAIFREESPLAACSKIRSTTGAVISSGAKRCLS